MRLRQPYFGDDGVTVERFHCASECKADQLARDNNVTLGTLKLRGQGRTCAAGKSRFMKLLLVTDTYPPDINGVARTLRTWAEALYDNG